MYSPKNNNKDPSTYPFLISFLMTQNFQLFLPCYFGNELSLSSNALSFYSYSSNWMFMTNKSKTTFVHLLEQLKSGSQIVVGKLFTLDLETYVTVNKINFKAPTYITNAYFSGIYECLQIIYVIAEF